MIESLSPVSRPITTQHRKIRTKNPAAFHTYSLPQEMMMMTRSQAIEQTVSRLMSDTVFINEALHQILLFHIQPEELTEAGLDYEILKMITPRCQLTWGLI